MKVRVLRFAALLVLCTCVAPAAIEASPKSSRDSTKSTLQSGVKLEDVVVYGSRKNFGVDDSQMSAIAIDKEQIYQVPAYFGEPDVMKALQKLPGVQASSDGTAGIFVRGGNYDQNLITLDGSTLYNAEHLKGFMSAINPDVVQNINFYRGAFPARYGSRLSSVVDIGVQTGDFYHYHGQLSVGMLASRINVSGPIWKGHTSFNIAGRVSYFDMIAYPTLKKYYDNGKNLAEYSDMNFYDINAKIVHKFNDRNRLSAVFYYGKDYVNSKPTSGHQYFSTLDDPSLSDAKRYSSESSRKSSTQNKWGNIVASLYYTSQMSKDFWLNVNLSYSQFRYKLSLDGESSTENNNPYRLIYYNSEKFNTVYHSDIGDYSIAFDTKYTKFKKHVLRFGIKGGVQRFNPTEELEKDAYTKRIDGSEPWVSPEREAEYKRLYPGYKFYWYDDKSVNIDTILGEKTNVSHLAVYAEDDYDLLRWLKVNYGVRVSMYGTGGKSYTSIEPRISLRWLLNRDMSVKMSYSRMSQAVRLLNSNNLVMPSDIWVPITERVPLMHSNLAAIGYNYEITRGINLSVEGYYKTMENVLEYSPGASYASGSGNWQDMTSLGKGRAYGVELYVEKRTGNTTGWLSYTWSKSLRTMDRPGQEINGGDEYYASNDRRNNFSANVSHHFRLSKTCGLDITASWSYITGRRGSIPTINIYGGMLDEFDPKGNILSSQTKYEYFESSQTQTPESGSYFKRFVQFSTYKGMNNYVFPAQHHLDLGVSFSVRHRLGESSLGLSIYNVYNQMNITSAYVSYDNNKLVLKGVCLFPIMPSINYTHKF